LTVNGKFAIIYFESIRRKMNMTDPAPKKTFRQVCTCENCGNEAEMIITCTLEPGEAEATTPAAHSHESKPPQKQRTGQATCTRCGNEAEILVDF
jgi:ribosomal protein S14